MNSQLPLLVKFATEPDDREGLLKCHYDLDTETSVVLTDADNDPFWATRSLLTATNNDPTSDEASDRI